jgi:hypothetical protein
MQHNLNVEGVPANINHTHNITLEVRVDQQTTKNIKDIATTVIFTAAAAAILKSFVGTGSRLVLDKSYAKLYPPVKW